MDTFALVVTIGVALGFTYTNGFHDSANAIATSVSTRALTPRAALAMAAVMNLLGAFLGSGVAKTVSEGLIETPKGSSGMAILFAALVGAITWNLITWYFGLPSSSSHALFGGMVGAALAGGTKVYWDGVLEKVVVPMFASPVVGLLAGYLVMTAILWIFRRANPHKTKRGFRIAQTVSAAGMALGHGLQDAQKTMGIVVMALVIAGDQSYGDPIPVWVKLACAGLRGGDHGRVDHVRHGVYLQGPGLHDPRHHLRDHGRGRDEEGEGGAVGGRQEHRPWLVHHDAGSSTGGCRRLRGCVLGVPLELRPAISARLGVPLWGG